MDLNCLCQWKELCFVQKHSKLGATCYQKLLCVMRAQEIYMCMYISYCLSPHCVYNYTSLEQT
jgi:hypothetical protein